MRKLPPSGTRGRRWGLDRRNRALQWIGRSSQRRMRQAPVLRRVEPDKLVWEWFGRVPYRWNIWITLDGGVTWDHPEDYWTTGEDRDFWPDGGSYPHLVVGVDAAGNEVTRRSNAVTPDGAAVLAALLWEDGGAVLMEDGGNLLLQ